MRKPPDDYSRVPAQGLRACELRHGQRELTQHASLRDLQTEDAFGALPRD
jgi:hypothetical protein